MRCVFHGSVTALLTHAEAQLMMNESENSLMLGLLKRIEHGTLTTDQPLYLSVVHDGEFLGHALRTSTRTPLDMSRMSPAAAECIAGALFAQGTQLNKVVGVGETSKRFADSWLKLAGGSIESSLSQGIYELRAVQMPDLAGGKLLIATVADRAIVIDLLQGFFKYQGASAEDSHERAASIANRDLNLGKITLWQDETGQVVSSATRVRETQNGVSISYVYTPKEFRRRGHAGRVVACLSQRILDSGKQMCNLYTDMNNPTSNSVYRKIGYQLIAEGAEITFSGTNDP